MAFFGGGTLGSPTRDPNAAGGADGKGRKNINNAPIIGTAISRDEYLKQQTTATPPPSTAGAASLATGAARSASERQRKRAAAGSTLTNPGTGTAATAVLQPKTLLGG